MKTFRTSLEIIFKTIIDKELKIITFEKFQSNIFEFSTYLLQQ